jgi:hypothetical protein
MKKHGAGWVQEQEDKSPFKQGLVTQQTLDSLPECTQTELVFSSPFSISHVFHCSAGKLGLVVDENLCVVKDKEGGTVATYEYSPSAPGMFTLPVTEKSKYLCRYLMYVQKKETEEGSPTAITHSNGVTTFRLGVHEYDVTLKFVQTYDWKTNCGFELKYLGHHGHTKSGASQKDHRWECSADVLEGQNPIKLHLNGTSFRTDGCPTVRLGVNRRLHKAFMVGLRLQLPPDQEEAAKTSATYSWMDEQDLDYNPGDLLNQPRKRAQKELFGKDKSEPPAKDRYDKEQFGLLWAANDSAKRHVTTTEEKAPQTNHPPPSQPSEVAWNEALLGKKEELSLLPLEFEGETLRGVGSGAITDGWSKQQVTETGFKRGVQLQAGPYSTPPGYTCLTDHQIYAPSPDQLFFKEIVIRTHLGPLRGVYAGTVDEKTRSRVLVALEAGERVGQVRAVVNRADIFVSNKLQASRPPPPQDTIWTMLHRSISATVAQCRNPDIKRYYTARIECLYKAGVWEIERLRGHRFTTEQNDLDQAFSLYEPEMGTLATPTKLQILALYYDLKLLWNGSVDQAAYTFFSHRHTTVTQLREMLATSPRPEPEAKKIPAKQDGKAEESDDDDEVKFVKSVKTEPREAGSQPKYTDVFMEDEIRETALKNAEAEVQELKRKLREYLEQSTTEPENGLGARKVQRSAPYSYSAGHCPTDILPQPPSAPPACTLLVLHPEVCATQRWEMAKENAAIAATAAEASAAAAEEAAGAAEKTVAAAETLKVEAEEVVQKAAADAEAERVKAEEDAANYDGAQAALLRKAQEMEAEAELAAAAAAKAIAAEKAAREAAAMAKRQAAELLNKGGPPKLEFPVASFKQPAPKKGDPFVTNQKGYGIEPPSLQHKTQFAQNMYEYALAFLGIRVCPTTGNAEPAFVYQRDPDKFGKMILLGTTDGVQSGNGGPYVAMPKHSLAAASFHYAEDPRPNCYFYRLQTTDDGLRHVGYDTQRQVKNSAPPSTDCNGHDYIRSSEMIPDGAQGWLPYADYTTDHAYFTCNSVSINYTLTDDPADQGFTPPPNSHKTLADYIREVAHVDQLEKNIKSSLDRLERASKLRVNRYDHGSRDGGRRAAGADEHRRTGFWDNDRPADSRSARDQKRWQPPSRNRKGGGKGARGDRSGKGSRAEKGRGEGNDRHVNWSDNNRGLTPPPALTILIIVCLVLVLLSLTHSRLFATCHPQLWSSLAILALVGLFTPLARRLVGNRKNGLEPPCPPLPPPAPPPPLPPPPHRVEKNKGGDAVVLRVCAWNAQGITRKLLELNWWLTQQESLGRQVDILLITEPLLDELDETRLHPSYLITPRHPLPAGYTTEHWVTRVMYRTDHTHATVSLARLKQKHAGVSWVRVHATERDIYAAALYIPTRRSAARDDYLSGLMVALEKNVKEIEGRGGGILIGTDANVPFKRAHAYPTAAHAVRNVQILKELLQYGNGGLTVLNWALRTDSFYTRVQGGAKSQLDLFLRNSLVGTAVRRLTIHSTLTFNSDHCLLDLSLQISTLPKGVPVARQYVCYMYEEARLPEYWDALTARTSTWLEATEARLAKWAGEGGSRGAGVPGAQQLVNEAVEKLDKSLLEAYSDTFKAVTVTKGGSKRNRRRAGNDLMPQIEMRERLKASVQALAAATGIHQALITSARDALKVASDKVHVALFDEQRKKAQDVAGRLDAARQADPRAFARTFRELAEKRKLPLPATMVNKSGCLVGGKAGIKQEWINRFTKEETEEGGVGDALFRKQILEMNSLHRRKGRSVTDSSHGLEYACTRQETKLALDKAKTGKSPDTKGVTNEMVKRSGNYGLRLLTALINLLLMTECFPWEWRTTELTPAHKKGDTQFASNYRPLGITAILYKLYERVLDRRLRLAISILPAQCGFRPGFGPHNVLAKIEILIKHCALHDIDLQLIMLDFKEAFERVWRPAILARLLQAGVGGKLWRIIDGILSASWSKVRTQFGTTASFRTWIGVIQGTVLGPLFFLLFITPMASTLHHLSANINGYQTSPFLFADDATLAAVGEAAKLALLTGAIMWARKWNAIISEEKSGILRILGKDGGYEPTIVGGMKFDERDLFKLLGVSVDREGLFTATFVSSLLARAHPRLETLLRLRQGEGSARLETVVYLYTMMVLSVLKYAIPFAGASSKKMYRLRIAQRDFTRKLLGLDSAYPGWIAAYAVGMMDIDLISAQERIMMHHRLVSNTAEVGYKEMMNWKWDTGGNTAVTSTDKLLKLLGIPLKASRLKGVDKTSLRETVTAAAMRCQALRMNKRNGEDSHTLVQQQHWGLEKALLEMPAGVAVPYLRLRLGDEKELRRHILDCSCLAQPSLEHSLWTCPKTATHRTALLSTLHSLAGQVASLFAPLPPGRKTQFALGGGQLHFPGQLWSIAQPLFVRYVASAARPP